MRIIDADVLFKVLHDRMKAAEGWIAHAETDEIRCRQEGFLSALIDVKLSVEDDVVTIRGRWKGLGNTFIIYGNDIDNAPTIEPETLDVDKHIELLGREYVAQDIKNGKGFIVGHFIREPITRCKDCEFYNGLVECEAGLLTDPDDFCKFGKKKEANE